MPSASNSEIWLRRVQGWLGLVPLAAYAVYHLVCQWPALSSRQEWTAQAASRDAARDGGWLGIGILLVLLVHAALGVRRVGLHLRAVHAEPTGPMGPMGQAGQAGQTEQSTREPLVAFQAFTGVLLAVFVAYHVSTVGSITRGPDAGPQDAYGVLWSTLGRPLPLIAYVVGVSALAFHLGTGVSRALARMLPEIPLTAQRLVVGGLALCLWLGYVQLVTRFALGEALFPGLL